MISGTNFIADRQSRSGTRKQKRPLNPIPSALLTATSMPSPEEMRRRVIAARAWESAKRAQQGRGGSLFGVDVFAANPGMAEKEVIRRQVNRAIPKPPKTREEAEQAFALTGEDTAVRLRDLPYDFSAVQRAVRGHQPTVETHLINPELLKGDGWQRNLASATPVLGAGIRQQRESETERIDPFLHLSMEKVGRDIATAFGDSPESWRKYLDPSTIEGQRYLDLSRQWAPVSDIEDDPRAVSLSAGNGRFMTGFLAQHPDLANLSNFELFMRAADSVMNPSKLARLSGSDIRLGNEIPLSEQIGYGLLDAGAQTVGFGLAGRAASGVAKGGAALGEVVGAYAPKVAEGGKWVVRGGRFAAEGGQAVARGAAERLASTKIYQTAAGHVAGWAPEVLRSPIAKNLASAGARNFGENAVLSAAPVVARANERARTKGGSVLENLAPAVWEDVVGRAVAYDPRTFLDPNVSMYDKTRMLIQHGMMIYAHRNTPRQLAVEWALHNGADPKVVTEMVNAAYAEGHLRGQGLLDRQGGAPAPAVVPRNPLRSAKASRALARVAKAKQLNGDEMLRPAPQARPGWARSTEETGTKLLLPGQVEHIPDQVDLLIPGQTPLPKTLAMEIASDALKKRAAAAANSPQAESSPSLAELLHRAAPSGYHWQEPYPPDMPSDTYDLKWSGRDKNVLTHETIKQRLGRYVDKNGDVRIGVIGLDHSKTGTYENEATKVRVGIEGHDAVLGAGRGSGLALQSEPAGAHKTLAFIPESGVLLSYANAPKAFFSTHNARRIVIREMHAAVNHGTPEGVRISEDVMMKRVGKILDRLRKTSLGKYVEEFKNPKTIDDFDDILTRINSRARVKIILSVLSHQQSELPNYQTVYNLAANPRLRGLKGGEVLALYHIDPKLGLVPNYPGSTYRDYSQGDGLLGFTRHRQISEMFPTEYSQIENFFKERADDGHMLHSKITPAFVDNAFKYSKVNAPTAIPSALARFSALHELVPDYLEYLERGLRY